MHKTPSLGKDKGRRLKSAAYLKDSVFFQEAPRGKDSILQGEVFPPLFLLESFTGLNQNYVWPKLSKKFSGQNGATNIVERSCQLKVHLTVEDLPKPAELSQAQLGRQTSKTCVHHS